MSAVYKGVLNFLPSIFVFAVVYLFFGNGFTFSLVVFLPVLFAIQTVTNIGIALIMSTATVFVRDMDNALSMITRVLLFTTPVIYPISLLPPDLKTILSFNPLYPLFANYQFIIGGGPARLRVDALGDLLGRRAHRARRLAVPPLRARDGSGGGVSVAAVPARTESPCS